MTPTHSQNNEVVHPGLLPEMKEHFYENKKYFGSLLGKDFDKEGVVFTLKDAQRVEEAYEKSHKTREFELSLYWQRLNFTWTITAILFAGWGFLVSGLIVPQSGIIALVQYVSIFAISIFGILLTLLSRFISEGGKYWQEVWEYHIMKLEPFKSGALYAMHFESTSKTSHEGNRPSISRSIDAFYFFLFIVWGASATSSAILPINSDSDFLFWIFLVIVVALIVLIWHFTKSFIYRKGVVNIKLK